MALTRTHDLHRRRRSRNLGLGLVLAAFVAIIFGLTIVKVTNGESMEGFDHGYRTSIVPEGASQ